MAASDLFWSTNPGIEMRVPRLEDLLTPHQQKQLALRLWMLKLAGKGAQGEVTITVKDGHPRFIRLGISDPLPPQSNTAIDAGG